MSKPTKNIKAYARAFYEATRNLQGMELTKAIERFVKILSHDRLLKKADTILAEVEACARQAEGIKTVTITTARPLTDAGSNSFKKHYGDQAEIEYRINDLLLGGAVVQVDDKIYDASLKTQLNNLKAKLTS